MIFLGVLPKIFLWPHYSGALGVRGLRFIEPPEPPVPTPLRNSQRLVSILFSINFHQTGGHLPSRKMAGTKLYCLVAKTYVCERFAEISCPKARRSGTRTLLIDSPLRH